MIDRIRMKQLNKWSNTKLKRHVIFLEKELAEYEKARTRIHTPKLDDESKEDGR